ncbi:hypothetical protein QTN25_003412 [Entamoeba marina]
MDIPEGWATIEYAEGCVGYYYPALKYFTWDMPMNIHPSKLFDIDHITQGAEHKHITLNEVSIISSFIDKDNINEKESTREKSPKQCADGEINRSNHKVLAKSHSVDKFNSYQEVTDDSITNDKEETVDEITKETEEDKTESNEVVIRPKTKSKTQTRTRRTRGRTLTKNVRRNVRTRGRKPRKKQPITEEVITEKPIVQQHSSNGESTTTSSFEDDMNETNSIANIGYSNDLAYLMNEFPTYLSVINGRYEFNEYSLLQIYCLVVQKQLDVNVYYNKPESIIRIAVNGVQVSKTTTTIPDEIAKLEDISLEQHYLKVMASKKVSWNNLSREDNKGHNITHMEFMLKIN